MAPKQYTLPIRPGRVSHVKPAYRRKPKENILGITKPSIRRIARRGGIMRIKSDIYDGVRDVVKERLSEILGHVVTILESSQTAKHDQKIVTTRDIVYALQRIGTPVYGFGTA